jgi:cytosine/adenosine deaminase-related metal-dependent hydrolase
MLLTARFVVPVSGPPIENGALIIQNGVIAEVGSASLGSPPTVDYGDAVVLPAFVNAHTHFELSLQAGKVPPSGDFVDWLRRLVRTQQTEPSTQNNVRQAVGEAVVQSMRAGVSCAGDITRWPAWTRPVLAASPLRAVSFGEVVAAGHKRTQLTHRLEAAASQLYRTQRLRCGISPHAPYTVEPEGLSACASRAHEINARLCIHVAESPDEEEFTQNGTGRLAVFLEEAGVWDDSLEPPRMRPIDLCRAQGVLGPRTLLAHANYISDADLDTIARSGASVAYCPRTHAAFGHPPHRFRDLLRAGVNLCIGTDSLASNPSLSVLDEVRFLHMKYPSFPAEELLRMGTVRGAAALGFAETVGTIAPGKAADLVVLPLNPGADRWEAVLESTAQPIAVYIDGVQTS